MRYMSIDEEAVNGSKWGVSLFVAGCDKHCKGCFNPETWSFDAGTEWTDESMKQLMDIINKPEIKRFSVLGGEPLAPLNVSTVYNIIKAVKEAKPGITIWVFTGDIISVPDLYRSDYKGMILRKVDFVKFGPFVESLKDDHIPFRGSSNQKIIRSSASYWEQDLVFVPDSEFKDTWIV